MQSRNARLLMLVVGLLLMGSISIVLTARLTPIQGYGPLDKEFYLSDTQIAFIRPGLDLEILEAIIPQDRRPVVKFSIKDPKGLPLDRDGVFEPSPARAGHFHRG